jgi:hypothetical protein
LAPINGGIPRRLAAVALAVTAGVQPVLAGRFTCFVIQPGDTAAHLARRLAGDAEHRHEPWFQVFDPAASRFLPKAEYGRILPGWQACIAEGRSRSELIAQERPRDPARVQASPGDLLRRLATADSPGVAWLGIALGLATLLAWPLASRYSNSRRALVNTMVHFGERFIREFERPLMRPGRHARALESRLRFKPRQRRLDILLAPHHGRTYPNLFDHRRNVEYDVGRVLRLLRDERFVAERLSGQGRWVIVRCRVKADLEPGGGT